MKEKEQPILKSGGTYLGMDEKDPSKLYYVGDDTHSLCIGATRCGKSRCVVLPSICVQALAGESMIVTDPKAELYLYTNHFLRELDYEVVTLDFKNPRKSQRYNFLQPVIDALKEKDIPLMIERARDIASSLVQQDTGERVWGDGERAIITSGILAVVYDNQKYPQYQNLTNVYHFLGNMCKPIGAKGELPLMEYLKDIPVFHPARATIDISFIAPSKMRGSFYTSALTTLNLFTDPNMYGMTCATDFNIYETGAKKRAIFIILPDHKSTYDALASLFVYQHYQLLVDASDQNGNRLENRVNFNLDEFGNFTKIPDFSKQITVGGGRGIRYNMFLQDFNQLDEVYGERIGQTIRSNTETWIYLQSDNENTLKELSAKLGDYTIKSPSLSGSTGGNSSASYNYMSRNLLTTTEVKQIARPYQLVTSRNAPTVMYAPDISQTMFNTLLGLGDKKHNQQLIIKRQNDRIERPKMEMEDISLWGIWDVCAGRIEKKIAAKALQGTRKAVAMNEMEELT